VIYFYFVLLIDFSFSGSTIEIEQGNLTQESEVTFEFKIKETKDLPAVLPFQIQMVYLKLNGTKVTRMLTVSIPTTTKEEVIASSLNIRVVSCNVAQQCSRLARAGDYEMAREKATKAKELLEKSIKNDEDKALFALFKQQYDSIITQLNLAKKEEEKMGFDAISNATEDVRVFRAANRLDSLAAQTYQLKSAKARACVIQ